MIYMIVEANELELPLATAGSLNELANICKVEASAVCRVIQKNQTTKLFNGIPAKIYKFQEDDFET